jgi:hypothetical protein
MQVSEDDPFPQATTAREWLRMMRSLSPDRQGFSLPRRFIKTAEPALLDLDIKAVDASIWASQAFEEKEEDETQRKR